MTYLALGEGHSLIHTLINTCIFVEENQNKNRLDDFNIYVHPTHIGAII